MPGISLPELERRRKRFKSTENLATEEITAVEVTMSDVVSLKPIDKVTTPT